MNNLLFDMKKIVKEGKQRGRPPELIRVELKEYLQYFVLDYLYNLASKIFIFYGGSCLRVVFGLPRMSEDLDFEAEVGTIDIAVFSEGLERYFKSNLVMKKVKISANTNNDIVRIILSFPIAKEVGLSGHKDETIKIKIEIRVVSHEYMKNIKWIFTPVSKFGKTFVLKHYDLPTLLAGKLAAILQRPLKGFAKGHSEEGIRFKGRDFYDLLWYMEKGILPNKQMLRANGVTGTIRKIFDRIALQISSMDLRGIQKDIEYLFRDTNYVNNWIQTFREAFNRLKKERYDVT